MSTSELSGKVQTVLGPIKPESLGITLAHEHLLVDLAGYFRLPDEASERAWVDAPITMDRLGGIGVRWQNNLDNLKLLDIDVAIQEVAKYRYAGGDSLVDTTSIGVGRDPLALARISRATGLNIVMGSSYYVPLFHPPDMDQRSEDSIADQIVRDVTDGVGDTGVRSGVIGEVGNFWPMGDNERKVLRASARAQQRTGASILIHPGTDPQSPLEIMEVLTEAGADPRRVILGHLDYFHDQGSLKSLAETGCYLEYDCFAQEDTSVGSVGTQGLIMPSDSQRMDTLSFLIDEGYGDRLLIAQDVCRKPHYTRYGGKGYAHVLENIVFRMRRRGFGQDRIDAMLVENPRRALTFV